MEAFCYDSYTFTDHAHGVGSDDAPHCFAEDSFNHHDSQFSSSKSGKGSSGLKWSRFKHSIRRLIPSDDTIRLSPPSSQDQNDLIMERSRHNSKKSFDFSTILDSNNEDTLGHKEEEKTDTPIIPSANHDSEMFYASHRYDDQQFNHDYDDESIHSNPVLYEDQGFKAMYSLAQKRFGKRKSDQQAQGSISRQDEEELKTELKAHLRDILALKEAYIQQRDAMLLIKSKNEWQEDQINLNAERIADLLEQDELHKDRIIQLEEERDSYATELHWSKEEAWTLKSEVERLKKHQSVFDDNVIDIEKKLQVSSSNTESQEQCFSDEIPKSNQEEKVNVGTTNATQAKEEIQKAQDICADNKRDPQGCLKCANVLAQLKRDIDQKNFELTSLCFKCDSQESEIQELKAQIEFIEQAAAFEGDFLYGESPSNDIEMGKTVYKNTISLANEFKNDEIESISSKATFSSCSEVDLKGAIRKNIESLCSPQIDENRNPLPHRDMQQYCEDARL